MTYLPYVFQVVTGNKRSRVGCVARHQIHIKGYMSSTRSPSAPRWKCLLLCCLAGNISSSGITCRAPRVPLKLVGTKLMVWTRTGLTKSNIRNICMVEYYCSCTLHINLLQEIGVHSFNSFKRMLKFMFHQRKQLNALTLRYIYLFALSSWKLKKNRLR